MDSEVRAHIRRRLESRLETKHGQMARLEELGRSQWSPTFESLMRNRLIMGAFRYGLLKDQKPNGYDNIGSAIERLKLYRDTGNLEHLVDAANLCLVEFVTGVHPNRHFDATDDGVHTPHA